MPLKLFEFLEHFMIGTFLKNQTKLRKINILNQ